MYRSNLITLLAFFWIAMFAVLILADASSQPVSAMSKDQPQQAATVKPTKKPPAKAKSVRTAPVVEDAAPVEPEPTPSLDPQDPNLVIAPYTTYTVTQGPHGYSYGHAAIDLTAGKGAEILSPINGSVSQLFTDELGNSTLVIENERYQVTLMHGNYSVKPGDAVTAGQAVGFESNNGNTVDWWGRSCQGRDCGYHSHLNIYDKQAGQNVNPLLLITPSQ